METMLLMRFVLASLVFVLLLLDYTAIMNQVYQITVHNGSAWKQPKRDKAANREPPPDRLDSTYWDQRNQRIRSPPQFQNDHEIDTHLEDDTLTKIGMYRTKAELLAVLRQHCLPKVICEMSSKPQKHLLTRSEQNLLDTIRHTTITVDGSITSRYHFAAHMGQLIMGVEGNGCHHFYPRCPFHSVEVMKMVRGRSSSS